MTQNDNAIDDPMHRTAEHEHRRYGSFDTDGDVLVYDRENPTGWIKSSVTVDLREIQ